MILKFINKVVSSFRRSLKRKSNKGTISILSFKFLGDTVFTIPAIELIRKNYPFSKITIFCYLENKSIYELFFNDINYECFGKEDWDINNRRFNFKIVKGIKKIRTSRFEMIFDFTVFYKSALICLFSGADTSVGFGNKLLEGFYDFYSPQKQDCHLMDVFVYSIERILPEGFALRKEFQINLKTVDRILIHPFAGWKAKEWNIEKYLELAKRLKNNFEVLYIAEKGFLSVAAINEIAEAATSLILSGSIEELFEAIRSSDLIVSNDTGIIYIASLLGKPTFTIYGPTNPDYSLPFGKYHRFIQKKIVCSPKHGEQYCWLEAGKKCPLFECMNRLTVDEVYESLSCFISEINNERIPS